MSLFKGPVTTGKVIFWVSLALVGIFILNIGLWAGGLAWRSGTAEIKGKVEAIEDIYSGENQLKFYNQFHDICADIQATEDSLDALYRKLDLFEQGSREYNQTLDAIAGNEIHRANQIRKYNADASKGWTWGNFRSSDLPYQLPTEPYELGGRRMICECSAGQNACDQVE